MTIVFYSDSKYEYQIESLIKSFKLNNLDCNFLYYTVGFNSSLEYPNLTKKFWDINPMFNSFCFYKVGICYDAIKSHGGNILFLDSDIIIGKRFDPEFFIHDRNYPISTTTNWNFPIHYSVVDTSLEFPVFKIGDRVVDKCENFGNIIDLDYNEKKYFVKLDYYPDNIKHCGLDELECLLIRDYKKLATYYNTDKKMGYVGTCLLSLNDSCLDFVSEWKSISENSYLHGISQTDYYPFHEETAINITYWKRDITENYGRIYVNTLYSDVIKHVEEDDNILHQDIFGNPNQKCVDSSKIQFYHGIVNKEELDKIIEYLESKTF